MKRTALLFYISDTSCARHENTLPMNELCILWIFLSAMFHLWRRDKIGEGIQLDVFHITSESPVFSFFWFYLLLLIIVFLKKNCYYFWLEKTVVRAMTKLISEAVCDKRTDLVGKLWSNQIPLKRLLLPQSTCLRSFRDLRRDVSCSANLELHKRETQSHGLLLLLFMPYTSPLPDIWVPKEWEKGLSGAVIRLISTFEGPQSVSSIPAKICNGGMTS